MLEKYLDIHPEIQKSISFGYPIVALESSVLCKHIPYPKNLEVCNNICKIIRNNGAVPATIAVINGRLKVGLIEEELELLLINSHIPKIDIINLPYSILEKSTGYTDFATTMVIANLAGIEVISTNDIEGISEVDKSHIHISSDLQKLCSIEAFIICSEINTNSNINITLDYLKSKGIPIIKYKKNCTYETTKLFKIRCDLGLKGGLLLINTNESKLTSKLEKENFQIYINKLYSNAKVASSVAKNFYYISQIK